MRIMFAAIGAAVVASPALGASAPPRLQHGRILFVAACGSCHTLPAAGTHGRKGPNLADEGSPYADIVDQVVHGGGGMPAFGTSLTKRQIGDIAAFVAKATSGRGD